MGLPAAAVESCHRIRRFKERKMERYLTGEERARLAEALERAKRSPKGHPDYVTPGAIVAIRLLELMGARCGEILGLQWSMVHLEPGQLGERLELPDSKTGAKIIPLSGPAVALLRGLERERGKGEADGEDSCPPWVCVSERGRPLGNLERSWRAIRKRAGLEDVRLHDLRHSAASDMAACRRVVFSLAASAAPNVSCAAPCPCLRTSSPVRASSASASPGSV
jgi:integrase